MTALNILTTLVVGASIDTFNRDGSRRWGHSFALMGGLVR